MTPLWTAHDLLEATGGTMGAPFAATGVSIDTRTSRPGDLFVALRGETGDGHAFVADAIAKGAAGAMVHRDVPQVSRAAAASMIRWPACIASAATPASASPAGWSRSPAASARPRRRRCCGRILTAFGTTHAAVASYNNHWGVPLTLARLPPDAAFCVAEIGMNHAGEIAPLARLARPHVAVITAVEKAHIGYPRLASRRSPTKRPSILRGLEPGGIAVLPADTPLLPRLRAAAGDARIVTFGDGAVGRRAAGRYRDGRRRQRCRRRDCTASASRFGSTRPGGTWR